MRKALLLSLLSVACFSAPLQLEELWQRSLNSNPDLKIKKLEKEQAESKKESQSFSGLLPTIDFEAQAAKKKGSATSASLGTYNYYESSLNLSQPLLKGGALWSGLKSSSDEVEIKELEEQITLRDHTQKLILAFYAVLLNQRSIDVFEKQIDLQRQLLATARQRLRQGAETKLSVLQFQTQLALLEPKLTDARSRFENSKTRLQTLLSDPDLRLAELSGSVAQIDTLSAPSGQTDQSLEQRLELKRQDLILNQQEHNWTVAMSDHYPSLYLVGQLLRSGSKSSDLQKSGNNRWTLGVNLTIPLFTGLSSLYERRQWAAQKSMLEIQKKALRDNLHSEWLQTQKDLVSLKDRLRAAKLAFDLATQAQIEARRLYQIGRVDYPRLFDTQSSVIEAELDLDKVRQDYLTLVLQAYVSTGKDLKEIVQKL